MPADETTHAETLLRFAANAEGGAILLVSAKGKSALRAGAAALAREQRLVAALNEWKEAAVACDNAFASDEPYMTDYLDCESQARNKLLAALTDTPEGR